MWKKSNEATAANAVMIPAARPPSAATATTTIISTSAALVLLMSERGMPTSAPTTMAAGTPTAHPIKSPVRSMPSGWAGRADEAMGSAKHCRPVGWPLPSRSVSA